jgi:hypothetical protein
MSFCLARLPSSLAFPVVLRSVHLDAILPALVSHVAPRRISQVGTTRESADESEIENHVRKYPRNLTLDISFNRSRSTTRGVVS